MRRDRVESREGGSERAEGEGREREGTERASERASEGGETLLVSFTFRELCNALTLIRNLFPASLPCLPTCLPSAWPRGGENGDCLPARLPGRQIHIRSFENYLFDLAHLFFILCRVRYFFYVTSEWDFA